MDGLKKRAGSLKKEIHEAIQKINLAELRKRFDKLQLEIGKPDFWKDNKQAAETSKQASQLLARIEPWENLAKQLDSLTELINDGDEANLSDLDFLLKAQEQKFAVLKKELSFSGPYDDHDAILSIHAGAGGTDAQDWAQMLERMYLRWAEKHNLKTEVIDESAGEEAGIKSATIKISGGGFLYGRLVGEHGVHRLVRISPFNSGGSRETSFAKVEVMPLIDKPDEVQLDEKDLKIDVFRSGGHGGQSVNTTDSAVRVTHLPTNIVVSVQNERSQLQNRETALGVLRGRLAALQAEQHAVNLADVKGPNQSAEFGNQIRNYVLHPYKQVKDTRTGYESSDPQKVLDGDLDPLIDAWLESS